MYLGVVRCEFVLVYYITLRVSLLVLGTMLGVVWIPFCVSFISVLVLHLFRIQLLEVLLFGMF